MTTKVQVTKIIGGRLIYSAWEKGKRSAGTLTHIDGEVYGRIGTDPDHALFDHLPAHSAARMFACQAAYEARREFAYGLIMAEFPGLVSGDRAHGEIVVEANRTPMIDFEHVDDAALNHFIAQMAQFHSESTPINKAFFMEHLKMGLEEHARRAAA